MITESRGKNVMAHSLKSNGEEKRGERSGRLSPKLKENRTGELCSCLDQAKRTVIA